MTRFIFLLSNILSSVLSLGYVNAPNLIDHLDASKTNSLASSEFDLSYAIVYIFKVPSTTKDILTIQSSSGASKITLQSGSSTAIFKISGSPVLTLSSLSPNDLVLAYFGVYLEETFFYLINLETQDVKKLIQKINLKPVEYYKSITSDSSVSLKLIRFMKWGDMKDQLKVEMLTMRDPVLLLALRYDQQLQDQGKELPIEYNAFQPKGIFLNKNEKVFDLAPNNYVHFKLDHVLIEQGNYLEHTVDLLTFNSSPLDAAGYTFMTRVEARRSLDNWFVLSDSTGSFVWSVSFDGDMRVVYKHVSRATPFTSIKSYKEGELIYIGVHTNAINTASALTQVYLTVDFEYLMKLNVSTQYRMNKGMKIKFDRTSSNNPDGFLKVYELNVFYGGVLFWRAPTSSNLCERYHWNTDLNQASRCFKCVSSKHLKKEGTCTDCDLKEYTNTQYGYCSLCNPNCDTCNDEVACVGCKDGYFTLEKTCQKCSPNCITCDSRWDKCTSCSAVFYLDASYRCNSILDSTNVVLLNQVLTQCTPYCLGCEKKPYRCLSCNFDTYLPLFGTDPEDGTTYLTCVHRTLQVGGVKKSLVILPNAVSMFFPLLGPLHMSEDSSTATLYNFEFPRKLVRGWIKLKKNKLTGKLNKGSHTVVRITQYPPDQTGDDFKELVHNVFSLTMTYDDASDEVRFYAHFSTGTKSVGLDTFNLHRLNSSDLSYSVITGDMVQERWIYVGGTVDWERGEYLACVVIENIDSSLDQVKDNSSDVKIVLSMKASGFSFMGGLMNDVGYMGTRFYLRFGGYGKLGLFENENDDNQAIYYKSWYLENCGSSDQSYFVNHANGDVAVTLLFRFTIMEHYFFNTTNDSFDLVDDTPNFHRIEVFNAKLKGHQFGWPGSEDLTYREGLSIKPDSQPYTPSLLTKSIYFKSTFRLAPGTPYLISFFYSPPETSVFPPSGISEVLMKGFRLECTSCINGRPVVQLMFKAIKYSGVQVRLEVEVDPPGENYISKWYYLIGDGMISVSYERMLHSDFVTWKLMSTFAPIDIFSTRVGFKTTGNTQESYTLFIGNENQTNEQPFYGTFRNFTIFLHTTVQTYCEPGCLYCTKNFDCLAVKNGATDFLYDFKVHKSSCPIDNSPTKSTDPSTYYCANYQILKMITGLASPSNSDANLTINKPEFYDSIIQTPNHHNCWNNQGADKFWISCLNQSPNSYKNVKYEIYVSQMYLNDTNISFSALASPGYALKNIVFTRGVEIEYSYDYIHYYTVEYIDEITSENMTRIESESKTEKVVQTTSIKAEFSISSVQRNLNLYVYFQVENRTLSNHKCPHLFTNLNSNPDKLRKCIPNLEIGKKCHRLCSDCIGSVGTVDYCLDCDPIKATRVWTTSDKRQFICMEKAELSPNQLESGDVLECKNPIIENLPIFIEQKYEYRTHPINCSSVSSNGSFDIPANPTGIKYRQSSIMGLIPGDYVSSLNSNWVKSLSGSVEICANQVHLKVLSPGIFRCCKYGKTDLDCFLTCYDKEGTYPFNNSYCKTCFEPLYSKVTQLDTLTSEPIDSICVELSACREYNQTTRTCYECPPGYIGIKTRTLDFKCKPCPVKLFDPKAGTFACLIKCNIYPFYFFNQSVQECERCPNGTFFNPQSSQCELVCTAPNLLFENTYCADCNDQVMRIRNSQCNTKCPLFSVRIGFEVKCMDVCPPHLYQNATSRICESCLEPPLMIYEGICVLGTCEEGRFLNQDNECIKCNEVCKSCEGGPNICTSCHLGSGFSIPGKPSLCFHCGIECIGCHLDYYRNCTNCSPPLTGFLDRFSGINYCRINLCPPGMTIHPLTGADKCAPCSFKYPGCDLCNTSECEYCLKGHQPIYQYKTSRKEEGFLFKECRSCSKGPGKHPHFLLEPITKQCVDICGDGARYNHIMASSLSYYLECDDGNLIDGDGCSSDCKLEPNYRCTGGSFDSPDKCEFMNILEGMITTVNEAELIFMIEFNDQITYVKENQEILNMTLEGMVEGTDYDYKVDRVALAHNRTGIKLTVTAYVSIVNKTLNIFMDNFNVKGSKGQILLDYNMKYLIGKHIRTTQYDKVLFAIFNKGSTYILLTITLFAVFVAPTAISLYLNHIIKTFMVFLLPVGFDASTQLIMESFLYPIIAFDFFKQVEHNTRSDIPDQFRRIGISTNFAINSMFPLLMIALSYSFVLFLRVQIKGQLIEKENNSKWKLFFFQAKRYYDISGHFMLMKALYPQLLMISLLFIVYFDPRKGGLGMLGPACTFIYCLTIIAQYFMVFTYHLLEGVPKDKEIDDLRYRRRILVEYGFEENLKVPEQELTVINEADESMRMRFAYDDSEMRRKRRLYSELDFFSAYKKRQKALSKRTVEDYELESLKYHRKYRHIIKDLRIESFWARIIPLLEILQFTLSIHTLILMSEYPYMQISTLISLNVSYTIYIILARPYKDKFQTAYQISSSIVYSLMSMITLILQKDNNSHIMSAYIRYRIVDRGILQHMAVYMVGFHTMSVVWMHRRDVVAAKRFMCDNKYYKMMNDVMYCSVHGYTLDEVKDEE